MNNLDREINQLLGVSNESTDLEPEVEQLTGKKRYNELDKEIDLLTGKTLPVESASVVTFDAKGAPVVNATGYSPDDLIQDKFYKVIEDYMRVRFGEQSLEDERDEVVNKFLNNMRGFASGNSVRAVNELSFMNSVETQEEKEAAARAYAMYENMEGFFGEQSGMERLSTAGDFVRTALLDPVNALSLGVGKAVTSGGLKLTTNVAQKAATKELAASGIKKVTEDQVRKKIVDNVGKTFAKRVAAEQLEKSAALAARNKAREAAVSNVQKIMTKNAWKEIAATGVVDGMAAAATDYAYQNVMLRTQVQDEYNALSTGASALASLVLMGGVQGATQLLTRTGVGPNKFKADPSGVKLNEFADKLKKQIKGKRKEVKGKMPKARVRDRKGIDLADADTDFFVTFMLGNDAQGVDGLVHTLVDQGYGWSMRTEDDTITQFLADVVEDLNPTDFKEVLKSYESFSGNKIKGLEDVTPKEFADIFKDKMSNQGVVLNAASQARKALGIDTSKITVGDYLEFQITGKVPSKDKTLASKVLGNEGLLDRLGVPVGTVSAAQNRLIRLLVTNPSTSMLNIAGFGSASTLNSLTDVSMSVLHAGASVIKETNGKGLTEAKKILKNAYNNQMFKLANTLDPNTTFDMFQQYGLARPQAVRELMRVLPGGVENLEKISDGLDTSLTRFGNSADSTIDTLQKLTLVTAQDAYTKSIEFITQMDKGLRREFGMGYKEFFEKDDYWRKMASEKYAAVELKAVDDTLSTIFSKSYKNPKTPLGEVAGFIEDARSIPGIGMLMPFGRFFNNTVAFMADHSWISLVGRVGRSPVHSTMSNEELIVRSTIATVGALSLAAKEAELIEKGYAWNQEDSLDNSGAVKDVMYTFPYAPFKAAARIIAHKQRGEEVPEGTRKSIADTFFGQFTRQLGGSGEGIYSVLSALMSGEGEEISSLISDVGGKIAAQSVAAGTRFMEPVNMTVGLARGEDYKRIDLKQGNQLFRESTRYMSQIIDSISGGDMEERFSPTQGKIRLQPSKMFSTNREVKVTELDRLYNMMGLPTYLAGLQSDDPATKNRYAKLYNELNTESAKWLMKDSAWRDSTQDERKQLWKDVASKNKERVLDYMRGSPQMSDYTMSKIIDIESKSSQKELNSVLQKLGYDKPLDELDLDELLNVETYLDTIEEVTKMKVFEYYDK